MTPKGKSGRRSPDFGVELPVLDLWRQLVSERLKERGAKGKLAKAIGVSASAISDLLNGNYTASSLVRAISEHVDVAVPMPIVDDDEMADWFNVGINLRDTNREAFLGMLRTAKAMTSSEQPPRRHPKGTSNGK